MPDGRGEPGPNQAAEKLHFWCFVTVIHRLFRPAMDETGALQFKEDGGSKGLYRLRKNSIRGTGFVRFERARLLACPERSRRMPIKPIKSVGFSPCGMPPELFSSAIKPFSAASLALEGNASFSTPPFLPHNAPRRSKVDIRCRVAPGNFTPRPSRCI